MSCEDTWGRASGRGGGNSQCGGLKAGVCLACFENMFEEAGVAETSEGDSSRRGAWRGGGQCGTRSCRGRVEREDLGSSSERNGEPVQGF